MLRDTKYAIAAVITHLYVSKLKYDRTAIYDIHRGIRNRQDLNPDTAQES